MAIFSAELCRQKLKTWSDAEDAVATGQSYQIGTRSLTRADLSDIRKQMEYWSARLCEAENEAQGGGRNRAFRVMIRDL